MHSRSASVRRRISLGVGLPRLALGGRGTESRRRPANGPFPLISNFYSALGAGAATGLVGTFPDNAVLIAFPTRGRFTGACLAGILVTVTVFCFAQRLRCASAIFFRASGESVLLFGVAATAGLNCGGRPLRLGLTDPAMRERASWRRAISSSKAATIEDVFIPIR